MNSVEDFSDKLEILLEIFETLSDDDKKRARFLVNDFLDSEFDDTNIVNYFDKNHPDDTNQ